MGLGAPKKPAVAKPAAGAKPAVAKPAASALGDAPNVRADPGVPFPAFFYSPARSKTEQRKFVADVALTWLRVQHTRGACGAVMIDIDDTLIDGNETVQHGFQFMKALYTEMSLLYPIHVVTARPDSHHAEVMRLLHARGFCVQPDRLHMLPAEHYDRDLSYVERFKWGKFLEIGKLHGGVVARFGDKLWDVAHLRSLRDYLGHVADRDCYVFLDPALGGAMSGKLPGM